MRSRGHCAAPPAGRDRLTQPGERDWAAIREGGDLAVTIQPGVSAGAIKRVVTFTKAAGVGFEEIVWPMWVPEPDSDTAVAGFETHWEASAKQARDTAKWLATILGAALAALIGTAPLSGLRNDSIPWTAYLAGCAGLILMVITLGLVIRVLIPQITVFDDLIQGAPGAPRASRPFWRMLQRRDPLRRLRERINQDSGVLLPAGIMTLSELAGRSILEAVTLGKLADGIKDDAPAGRKWRGRGGALPAPAAAALTTAQDGRGDWLDYLTQIMAQWTTIASYDEVRQRFKAVQVWGLLAGTLGAALIALAFVLPSPRTQVAVLTTYKLAPAASAAQGAIGTACLSFKGVVVSQDSQGMLTVLVTPSATCDSAAIQVPGADLIPLP